MKKKSKDVTAKSLAKEAETERETYLSERHHGTLNRNNDKALASIELQIRKHHGGAIMNLMNIGRELLEAKKRIAHGEFANWVISLGLFSLRTAQKYMRLYEKLWPYPNLLSLIQNKDILELLVSNDFPKELMRLLNDNIEGVYSLEEQEKLIICSFGAYESNDATNKVLQHIIRNHNNNTVKAIFKKDANRIILLLEKEIKYYENLPYSKYDNPLLGDNKDSDELCIVMKAVLKEKIAAIERVVNDYELGGNMDKFLCKYKKTMAEEKEEEERAIKQNESDSAAEEVAVTKYMKFLMSNLSPEDYITQ